MRYAVQDLRSDTDVVGEATAHLDGLADLPFAARRQPVPAAVQLGVLAHADLERLATLGRLQRRGSIRRAWGVPMAALAGDVAGLAGDAATLRRVQREVLVPLELTALGAASPEPGRAEVAAQVRAALARWAARPA